MMQIMMEKSIKLNFENSSGYHVSAVRMLSELTSELVDIETILRN
jgi:hypothetical protein